MKNNKIFIGIIVVLLLIIAILTGVLVAKSKKDTASEKNADNTTYEAELPQEELAESNEQPVDETLPNEEKNQNANSENTLLYFNNMQGVEGTMDSHDESAQDMQEMDSANEVTAPNQKLQDWQMEPIDMSEKASLDIERNLSEMSSYWEQGNMEAVEDLAYLNRYLVMSALLHDSTEHYYYGQTNAAGKPEGTGIAVYAENEYYYGDFKDGLRAGNGMWIRFYYYDAGSNPKDSIYHTHSYQGEWDKDLPNGKGAEHYDFIVENLKDNRGYNQNYLGTFANGLYDGEIYITNLYKDGNSKEWQGTCKFGTWESLGEADKAGRSPVIYEITNPENYMWLYPEEMKACGVSGLISSML